MISYTQELALLLSALGTYWLARRLGRRSVVIVSLPREEN